MKKTVLIIEDDADTLELVEIILDNMGIEVVASSLFSLFRMLKALIPIWLY